MNISVVLCTYNGERFLEQQLASIRSQTRLPSELILCDDGSTDRTCAIVKAFADTAPFAVHFHRNSVNLGSTRNFEKAIRLAHGDAIALCDQDDCWAPEKLAAMQAVLDAQPEIAGVFSNARLIDEDGSVLPGDLWQRGGFTSARRRRFASDGPHQLIRRDTVTGATLLFRASFVEHVLPIPSDWVHDGWIALLLATLSRLQPLPACLVDYRLHAGQQIGATVVPWQTHLGTEKQAALEWHRRLAFRFASIAKRLEKIAGQSDQPLPSTVHVRKDLHRKIAFLHRRASVLQQSRPARIPTALRALPDYVRYERGLLSLMRDLLH